MSEFKVGDTVWAKVNVVTADPFKVSRGLVSVRGHLDTPTWVLDSALIPDVPGLPALAALIAEVGPEKAKASLMFGNSALVMIAERDRFKTGDEQADNYEKMVSDAAALLLRIALAMGAK